MSAKIDSKAVAAVGGLVQEIKLLYCIFKEPCTIRALSVVLRLHLLHLVFESEVVAQEEYQHSKIHSTKV